VHSDDVGPGEGKDVPDADSLNLELDSWELVKEIPEPVFDRISSLESAACRYLTRVDKHPIIPPPRHELGQVMAVQRLESFRDGLLGNKCSDH
jgi:hypothetical protein